ncbi:patatin-like phospholipase family protein [Pontibacter arcticus]|uniref:PNPLA domain-containing protein n=1 Tax=Pontibacter arcticus TaxID=2080288 RepID=A0A364RG83_9BACT|nr:patatin-like phospholipase family protein [Pontibacter arcticus]RAU83277.1 hypothetical protein DP923_08690 [Pontibacter arcticus]
MRIGLVLSGGAARGIAHLGVLKALDEFNIKIDAISGVSSGAVAGIFYAAGYKPTEILKLIKELSLFQIIRPTLRQVGFMHLDEIEKLFCKYLGANRTFEQLRIPVTVTATEINKAEIIYFSEGSIIQPLLASVAAPIIYKSVVFEDKVLQDGGLLNNMPIDPIRESCDKIIGVHVNPINKEAKITTMRGMIERTLQLAVNNNVKLRLPQCDLVLEPEALVNYRLTSFRKADEIFEVGYQHALKHETALRKLAESSARI